MKTTPEHFEIFKAECKKWIEIFGLKNWRIDYIHKKLSSDSRAQTTFNCVSSIATIFFNTKPDEEDEYKFTVETVKKTAFHEVCEILLGRLSLMVGQRYALHELDVEEATHQIIRILENVLWKEE